MAGAADKMASEDPPTCSDETIHLPSEPVCLRFPTIDLNTSLESLLSHSTPTASEASTIMATPTLPPRALDESWASLDISDFSHDDDDTQSVNSDPGSLIDLSSVHDTESAAGEESQDELGVDEERAASISKPRFARYSEEVSHQEQQELSACDSVEDTIILQQSTIQNSQYSIMMEHVRGSSTASDGESPLKETISMKISPNDLKPFDTPVRVCYYGSPSSPVAKDELLGKIGAALLVPTSDSGSQTSTTSTCFNIVPTEFGPGSKPAFADLVPSQTQMAVDELSVVSNHFDVRQHDIIHLRLRNGVVMDSMLGDARDNSKDFRPDLFVIHLCVKDFKDHGDQFYALLKLAHRHCWPTIVVADDSAFDPFELNFGPEEYGIQITSYETVGSHIHQSERPIDLDTFLALDTVQLSRHIKYLMENSFENSPTQEQRSPLARIIHHLILGRRPRQFILKRHETKCGAALSPSSKKSWTGEVKQVWSTVEGRRYVKDLAFTLIVMMLGIYIVSFSQNFSAKISDLVGSDDTTSLSNKTHSTATVTATSAIAVTTTTSTAPTANNQDIALYDPVLFDQMWHRLTGRQLLEQENDKPPKKSPVEERKAFPYEAPKKSVYVATIRDQITQWLSPTLNMTQPFSGDGALLRYVKSLPKYKMKSEMRDLHEKLQNFYKDVTTNVPKTSLSSQKHLRELVDRSQHLLKETRWASKKKLEKLVTEQKTLLSHAQHQARRFLSPEKKRKSFFKRKHGSGH